MEQGNTKPGTKRLWITLTTILPFILGLPLWQKYTQVYRAPLPYKEIEALENWASRNTLQLPCYLNVIFVSPEEVLSGDELDSVASSIKSFLQDVSGNSSDAESCQDGFRVSVAQDSGGGCSKSKDLPGATSWPCGLEDYGIFYAAGSSDDILDNVLWNYAQTSGDKTSERATQYEGGVYTVVVMRKSQVIYGVSLEGELDEAIEGSCEENDLRFECSAQLPWRTVVGKYRHAWIAGEFDSGISDSEVFKRLGEIALIFQSGATSGSGILKPGNLPLSVDGETIVSFSLLNADPSSWIFDWDFEALYEQFIEPVTEALNGVARLFVESQVLFFTPKAVESHWDNSLKARVLPIKQLPFFVNSNEWHLDSSTAAARRSKVLHFAIYVPGAKEYPLRFLLKDGKLSPTNSFTSPGWGGVVVYNPKNVSDKLHSQMITFEDFVSIAGIFVAQLRTLFGFTPVLVGERERGLVKLSPMRTGFAHWELDLLLRRRSSEDFSLAVSTLSSLSRLVSKLPGMVIKDEIGQQVKSSLDAAAAARSHAAEGLYLSTGDAAGKASQRAEEAFLHPSIKSILYNPTEHHLAIYTPFFVPVLMHSVLAVAKEVLRFCRQRRDFKLKKE